MSAAAPTGNRNHSFLAHVFCMLVAFLLMPGWSTSVLTQLEDKLSEALLEMNTESIFIQKASLSRKHLYPENIFIKNVFSVGSTSTNLLSF